MAAALLAYDDLVAEGTALRRCLSALPMTSVQLRAQVIGAVALLDALLLHAAELSKRPCDAYLVPQAALLVGALGMLQTALLHTPNAALHYELYWRGACVDARAAAYARTIGAEPCACAGAESTAPRAANAELLIAYSRLAELTEQPFDALFEGLVNEGAPDDVDALAEPFEAEARARLPTLEPTERCMADALLGALGQMRCSPSA